MTRPTRPPGPPSPDDDPPPPRPTFTPRPPAPPQAQQPAPPQPGPPPQAQQPQAPQPAPPPQSHPYGRPPQAPAAGRSQAPAAGRPQAPAAGPPQGPPAGPPQGPPAGPPRPTFTPRQDGERPRGGRHGAPRRGDDRPRPTFTPREGYLPPPDIRQRAAYPPPATTFLPPLGYTQTFGYPEYPGYSEAPPRTTAPRRRAPGGRPPGGQDRSRVLEAPEVPEVPGTGPHPTADTQPNLARSSQIMALGTIASRATGFLRTFVFVAALGVGQLSIAYNNANTLPNTVYYLMLGGIFTSVVVPLLVKAAKEDPDRGEAYAERIFTLGVVALLAVTVIAMMLAVPLVNLYAGNITGEEHHVMVLFAYFFIPQIFFYGMDSLLGAILNTRGRFGPNMWTPVINNVVVIAVGGLFVLVQGLQPKSGNIAISPGGVQLLGIGTTLGIVIQSVALFPIMRRAGFSMRLRWDLRRAEVSEIGRMSGWMLGYVASQWAGNLVVQRVANVPAVHGYSTYSYAWQLFQLPYAIVGLSVISALLPRMSGHASDRRYSLVREDFSTGVRLASVIVVPAAVFLGVLGAPLCEFLFSYGSNSPQDARLIGEVFGMFSLGLVPFMLTQLQLRVFYSFHENRTPAIIGMVMLVVGVIGNLVALSVLPSRQVVIGLAAAYDIVTLTGAVLAWPLLLRQVGSLDGWRITRSLVRMFLATLPGLMFAFVVMAVTGSVLHGPGRLYGLVSTVIGGGGALLLYAFCAKLLGIEEFRILVRSVVGRFARLCNEIAAM
jgi:putative peptidoglycan lipid II flippase